MNIILNEKRIKRILISGSLTKEQRELLRIPIHESPQSYLLGFIIKESTWSKLLSIKANKCKQIKLSNKEKKKAKKQSYKYKIPEIRNVEVKPYSHPELGTNEYSKFYSSTAWRQLRYLALKNAGGCQCCGAKASDGVQIHVDHIKPRSRYPELELSLDNIQVLCEDCNIGKGDWDNTDWRGLE